MGSIGSHPSGTARDDDGSVAAIVNDGSASKSSASLGARHTVDEPSNPAVVAQSSRQATDHIVAPATAAVCPDVVTRQSQSQSQSLFKDGTDQNAVPVRVEKPALRYRNSKKHNCPTHMTTPYSVGVTKRFSSPYRKPPCRWPNLLADQPYKQFLSCLGVGWRVGEALAVLRDDGLD